MRREADDRLWRERVEQSFRGSERETERKKERRKETETATKREWNHACGGERECAQPKKVGYRHKLCCVCIGERDREGRKKK